MIFKSRKFWAALTGLAVALFGERAGISAEALVAAVSVAVSFIIGTAIEDGLRARNQ